MDRTRSHRGLALVTSALLLAALTAATVVAPASAADPMCRGVEATITGTSGNDVIRGTNGRDIIAGLAGDDIILGRGGNDLICGGLGDDRIAGQRGLDRIFGNAGGDRLFGGKGPDLLFGGVGDDLLVGRHGSDGFDGGPGTDRCFQNAGSGPKVSCELPVAKAESLPAPKPDPIDLTSVLAIAYVDQNANYVPDEGDVMISQLVDTDGNGPDEGDVVEMGLFPTKHEPVWPDDFAAWGVQSHTVYAAGPATANSVSVQSSATGYHGWYRLAGSGASDQYSESITPHSTNLCDGCASGSDAIQTVPGSPSQPTVDLYLESPGTGDDHFIEVELYLP